MPSPVHHVVVVVDWKGAGSLSTLSFPEASTQVRYLVADMLLLLDSISAILTKSRYDLVLEAALYTPVGAEEHED